jgi:hypothetical protein
MCFQNARQGHLRHSLGNISFVPVVNYRVARSTSMDRGFKINGYTADDYSGYSVSNAGDVNGDT